MSVLRLYSFKDHKDKAIHSTVITLLPSLSKVSPDSFVKAETGRNFHACMKFLLSNLKQKNVELRDKARIYVAIGQLASAVKDEILKYLPEILPELMAALSPSQKDKEKEKLKKSILFPFFLHPFYSFSTVHHLSFSLSNWARFHEGQGERQGREREDGGAYSCG
jgi:hypothetical protein